MRLGDPVRFARRIRLPPPAIPIAPWPQRPAQDEHDCGCSHPCRGPRRAVSAAAAPGYEAPRVVGPRRCRPATQGAGARGR
jgi:hypothetical protein